MIDDDVVGENILGGGVREGIVKLRLPGISIGTGVLAPTDLSLITIVAGGGSTGAGGSGGGGGGGGGSGSFLRTKSLRDFSSSSILPMLSFRSLFSPPRRESKLRR